MSRRSVIALCAALICLAPVFAAGADEAAEGIVRHSDYDMVLIHGLGSSAEVWDDMIPTLQNFFNVWVYEMPGHGSTAPIGDASVASFTHHLADYISEHGIHSPSLVGHGLGAMMAMTYAFEHPAAIDRLVLLDAAPKQLATAEQKAAIAQQLVENYDRFMAGYFLNMSPREEVNQKLVDQALRTDVTTTQQLMMSSFDFDLSEELPRQSIPMLVVGSGMMFPDPTRARDELERMGFGNAQIIQFKTMPSCGHFMMLEQPSYLASVIIAFAGLQR
jgi:pimeloyl-ACP methyl ester carboxylesterase